MSRRRGEAPAKLPSPGGVLLDQSQLDCLASPTRWEVFGTLVRIGPASVAEIGGTLGKAPDTLYYHIHRLVECGLIRSLGKRAATTRHEEIYEASFHLIRSDPDNRSPAYLAARKRLIASLIRGTHRHVTAALDRPIPEDAPMRDRLLIKSLLVRLAPRDADELVRRLDGVFEFVRERSLAEGGGLHAVLGVTAPVQEGGPDPSDESGPS